MSTVFMRFPGGLTKALTLSYDDGVEQDIRLIEIMNKHGIKGTFNINSGCFSPEGKVFPEGTIHRRLSKSKVLDLYANSGHEIAVHTLTHPCLETLPAAQVACEVLDDRRNLEQMFGKPIRGMAYPSGTFDDEVVEVLRGCGIAYSRTVESTEKFKMPSDWLRLPATCHHKNPRLMELADKFISMDVKHHPQLFYLWGHSYEFEQANNWHVIEEFCEKIGGKDDIWYATNIEIYDYVKAYESLIWALDYRFVTNPTAIPVYFKLSITGDPSRIVCVQPGETLAL